MYRLPGLSHRAAAVVVERAREEFPDWNKPVGRPKGLSLVQALRLTLCRLRRNATYQDLHEDFDIGRTTAWDYYQPMVEFLAREFGYPDEEDREELLAMLLEGKVCLVDGTLVPTFNWKHRGRELLSGKHRRYGVNIQLFVDLHGRLICASLAFPGSWHDIPLGSGGYSSIYRSCGRSRCSTARQSLPNDGEFALAIPRSKSAASAAWSLDGL